jgi:hypothetical protein
MKPGTPGLAFSFRRAKSEEFSGCGNSMGGVWRREVHDLGFFLPLEKPIRRRKFVGINEAVKVAAIFVPE